MTNPEKPGTYAVPAPNAILTAEQVAAWLQVKSRQVQRLGVPAVRLAHKTIRYRASDVTRWLERQAKAA